MFIHIKTSIVMSALLSMTEHLLCNHEATFMYFAIYSSKEHCENMNLVQM